MTIKHLVLSGGGINGFYFLGALYKLIEKDFLNLKNIKSIYASSAGSLVGLIFSLGLKTEDILEYVINRPWEKTIQFTPDMIFSMIEKKGILTQDFFFKILKKLFQTKNIKLDIKMKDFFEITKIEHHFYALNVSKFKLEDFSYKTHPEMKIIDVVYMSCSIPFVFQPLYYKDSFIVDGGMICSYPAEKCLNNCKINEILGLKLNPNKSNRIISKETNIFNYGYYLFDSLVGYSNIKTEKKELKYELIIPCLATTIESAIKLINNSELREKYIKKGEEIADKFLENIN